MLIHYLWVGLGGALGAITRVACTQALPGAWWGIPLPILCVNIVGCFLMGFLTEWGVVQTWLSGPWRYFVFSGFLGGFTTFSSFALEFGLLCERQAYGAAIFYALATVLVSFLFFFSGIRLARFLFF